MDTQPLLFDIPSIAETGVWCRLNDDIDPAQWAFICRKIGRLTPERLARVQDFLNGKDCKADPARNSPNPDSLFSRLKRIFSFDQAEAAHLPLVSIGPEKILERYS